MSLSPEQLALRRTGIGSSDIAALAGVDKYRTAIAVYVDKKLPIEEVPEAATGRNPRRWGQRLQRVIVQEWADIHGFKDVQLEEDIGTLRHPTIEIALASPDARALMDGVPFRLCEAKAPGLREAEDWSDDESPEGYLVQSQWQMGVSGVHANDLCALIGGQDFRMRALSFDAEMFGNLVEIALKFWTDHVLADRPPPLDHTDAAAEYLRRRFGLTPKAAVRELDPASEEFMKAWGLATEARFLDGQIKALKDEHEGVRNRLREMCGEAEGILGICTFKNVQRAGYSVDPTEYRELRLARQKKEKKR